MKIDDDVLLELSEHFHSPPWTPVSIDCLSNSISKYGKSAVKESFKTLISHKVISGVADESDNGLMEMYRCSSITPNGFEYIAKIKKQ